MDNDKADQGGRAMKVVVTGAAGNVGRDVVEALAERSEVGEIVGLERGAAPAELEPIFQDADAVIHLAWAIQPSHDPEALARVNLDGSRHVFDAVAAAGVPKLVCASSVSAYAPAPKDELIDESWPLGGSETSIHARHKATIEGYLDELESVSTATKVVRLRPALTFKGDASAELCRLLAGPFTPGFMLGSHWLPTVPRLEGLCFQAIHVSDLARAYALATTRDVSGPFNLAAIPPLDSTDLAASLGTSSFPISFSLARRLTALSWRMRLQPTPPDWLDMAMGLPLMSSARAAGELGWEPRVTAVEALADLFSGLRPTPPAPHRADPPPSSEAARRSRRRAARGKVEKRLVDQLTVVHSMSKQAVAQLQRAPRVAGQGRLSEIFATHLSETESQARLLDERLEAHGVDAAALNGTSGGIGPTVFAAGRPDTPGKLLAHSFSYEHLEISASQRLQETAARADDDATLAIARQVSEEARDMVDRLEGSFDLAVDASLNGDGPAQLDSRIDRWLADSQALEKQGLQLLSIASKVIEEEALRGFFVAHLDESEEHDLLLGQRLEARGAKPGKAGDALLPIVGMQVGAFFVAQADTTARLVSFVIAYEQLEIAAYEMLERLARRAGDREVTGVVGRILSEERVAVERLAQLAAAGS